MVSFYRLPMIAIYADWEAAIIVVFSRPFMSRKPHEILYRPDFRQRQ